MPLTLEDSAATTWPYGCRVLHAAYFLLAALVLLLVIYCLRSTDHFVVATPAFHHHVLSGWGAKEVLATLAETTVHQTETTVD